MSYLVNELLGLSRLPLVFGRWPLPEKSSAGRRGRDRI
jgi:hypothetical protein